PSWLPLVGGVITLEAAIYGLLNGLILTLIFAGFAVFNEVSPAHELVRLVPRAFHETGVVLSIALTFVPQTMRNLQRIREAQAVRGHRLKGLSDWLPIVIPLLVSGLERSMGLAEAMVARGYGAVASRAHPLRLQLLLLLGLLILLAGWLAWTFYRAQRLVAALAMLLGGGLLLVALWLAGRRAPRSRYRTRRWGVADTIVALGCLLTLAAVALPLPFVEAKTLYYSPYPALTMPSFDPRLGLLLLGLLGPVIVSWQENGARKEPGP
ncbi:MAG: energy-coupling factor transporter transmembrane protein EcfT, partial [Chloroflexi bacterium]|nr:energy-coupling factor transporter transmembrane protein EcfT [Chloroflexota bacterium]